MTDIFLTVLLCTVLVVVVAAGAATVAMLWMVTKGTARLLAEQDEQMRKTQERIERGARMMEHRFKP